MKLLAGLTVLDCTARWADPLPRFLESLGATIVPTVLGKADFAQALTSADFLTETSGLATLAAAGYDQAKIEALNPRLIHVSITPFGGDGPYASYRGGELVVSALSGVLRTVGYEDRAPVKEALDACAFHACGVAGAGAMFALVERGVSGRGQHVDISVHEVGFSRGTNGVLVWQFDKRKLARSGYALRYGRASVRCVWDLADGYCFHSLMSGRFGASANRALTEWMLEAGFDTPMRDVDWSRYDRSALPAETRAIWETAIAAFFRSRSKAEIASDGRRRGVNAAVAQEADDILTDPHLRERGYWRELALEDGARVEAPAYFLKLTGAAP